MMIVVAPAETELILAELLDACCAIAQFPVCTFFFEINLAGLITAHEQDALVQQTVRESKTFSIILCKETAAGLPHFLHFEDGFQFAGLEGRSDKPPIST